MKREEWQALAGCGVVMYLVNLLCTATFLLEVGEWNAATALVMLTALPVYSLAYLLPGIIATAAAGLVCRKMRRGARITCVVAGAAAAATQLLILADYGLFRNFGFHFNLFVWNLLTTPGGFASMGLRRDTVIPLTLVVILVAAADQAAVYLLCRFRSGSVGRRIAGAFRSWRVLIPLALIGLCTLVNCFAFAWHHFEKNSTPLLAAEKIPAYQRTTMHKFFRGIGFKEPQREQLLMKSVRAHGIAYPKTPIRRRPDRKKYNVVWLACESWRSDMLNPTDMPRARSFADRRGVSFQRNHSGGNGTRQGIFSMFYGLYGNYWHPFLASRTGALLIDWMIEDGYDFGCFTSAKFSYPEFDQTVFARIPADKLRSDDTGLTYQRDERNTQRLIDFITADRGGRPFMAFMFFESPHYPYEFPEKTARIKDYAPKVNYLKSAPEQRVRIKNRYRNSCATLDGYLGKVLDTLEKTGLIDNTIVVLIGDHGEEFFEHGRLGHNSAFTQQQILTPLVLHLPGTAPGTYDAMSSHLDVPAMLAPYFGVENPASDFSLGKNLLSPERPERKYTIVAGWQTLFFVSGQYKMRLPLNSYDAVTMTLYDGDDNPLPDPQRFFRDRRDELVEVQRDIRRFLK